MRSQATARWVLRRLLAKHVVRTCKREQALNALNVADSIREARNRAAHVAASEWELLEAEDFLMDGLRAFAKLARIVAKS